MLGIRGLGQEDPHEVQQEKVQTEQLHVSVQVWSSLANKIPEALVYKLNVAHQHIPAVIKTNCTPSAALARG